MGGLGTTGQPRVLGLRRKTFFICLAVVSFLVIAGAVSGGVGGTIFGRQKRPTASVVDDIPSSTTQPQYANTGLAALQYNDSSDIIHKRLYYQDISNVIRESAWDSNSTFDAAWQVSSVSDVVKPGTPLAAAAGYPHASHNYSLVGRSCFFASTVG